MLINLLPINSYIIVVTFHSLEDKIVKFFLKIIQRIKKFQDIYQVQKNTNKVFELINKKPILPSLKK